MKSSSGVMRFLVSCREGGNILMNIMLIRAIFKLPQIFHDDRIKPFNPIP